MASSEEVNVWCDRHGQTTDKCDTPVVCTAYSKGMTMPEDPVTDMQEAFGPLHEMYETHMNSGFSSAQALYLVAAGLTGSPGNPPRN